MTIKQLPLFPLGTVLFPQGRMPLQIFEPRYLKMVRDCQRDNAVFGLVALVQGQEVELGNRITGEQPVMQTVGTFARITSCESAGAGLLRISCRGEQRFRILNQQKLPQGLWAGEVEAMAEDQSIPIPEDMRSVSVKLEHLLASLRERGLDENDMPVEAPFLLNDCGWVANRWSELLPIPLPLKQDLLAQESPVLRLELVGDILERATLAF